MNYPQEAKLAAEMFDQGYKVERSDLASTVWPADTVSLFTITGGRILLKRLIQEVGTAACDNVATTVKFAITTASPYAAATVDFTAASASLAQLAIGSRVQVAGTALNTAVSVTSTIGPGLNVVTAPIILTPGTIVAISAVGAMTGTAVIKTSMWYVPLDDEAVVTTA